MIRKIYEGGSRIDFLEHLPSGLRVAYDDVPSVGTTAMAFFVAVGARDEKTTEWGMAHFLEHLVFKGAGLCNFREIARQMDRLGSEMNAFTTREYTCFYAKVLNGEAEAAYRLLCSLVREPWLKSQDIEREKNVVLEEIKESLDDPDDVVDTLLGEALYADAAYTHDILGTRASLLSITEDTLRAFFSAYYHPQNMVFAVSGGAVSTLLDLVRQDFAGAVSPSPLPRERPFPKIQPVQKTLKASWEQVKVALASPAPGTYSPHYAALWMMTSLLGGQNTSRLWQRLREEKGLVYVVSTHYAAESDFGEITTHLGLGADRLKEALTTTQEEITELISNGPDTDELERTRIFLETVLVMNLETPDARVMRLGRYALDGRVPTAMKTFREQFLSVTASDIQREAMRLADASQLARVLAGGLPPSLPDVEALWKGI